MRASPKISVRIDRGEDWVEMSGDWQDPRIVPICGQGKAADWVDFSLVRASFELLNEAIIE